MCQENFVSSLLIMMMRRSLFNENLSFKILSIFKRKICKDTYNTRVIK